MNDGKPTFVIGRVVSMERGHRTIVSPLSAPKRSAAEQDLVDAAQNWKQVKDDLAKRATALSWLMTAAEKL